MKKLDLGTITMGLDTLKDAFEQNTGIGWSELVDVFCHRLCREKLLRCR